MLLTTLLALVLLTTAQAADFDAGVEVQQRGDDAAALRVCRPLAGQGHAGAQFYLGSMYYYGEGVRRDCMKACAWAHIAAAQGIETAGTIMLWVLRSITPGETSRALMLAHQYREAYVLPFQE